MITVKELSKKLESLDYDLEKLTDEELEIVCRVDELRSHIGKLVRHFKGKIYIIMDFVEHTETDEELVIYKAMYGDYKKYARPIDSFISKVDKNKYPDYKQEYRFQLIELTSASVGEKVER